MQPLIPFITCGRGRRPEYALSGRAGCEPLSLFLVSGRSAADRQACREADDLKTGYVHDE